MKNKLFGLAAVATVSLALLTGCPSEKESTGTTGTEATGAAPVGEATGAAPTGEATGAAPAASGETHSTETSTQTASVDAKAIFSQKCAGCHGANGGGGMGPALAASDAKGDAFIENRIVNGSPEKGMPAFGTQLKKEEVSALVAYVKSL